MNIKELLLAIITAQARHIAACPLHLNRFLPAATYNREFKTVGLITARQTGKTLTITEMYRSGDLIVVNRVIDKRLFPKHFNVKAVCEFNERECYGIPIPQYGNVFIDEARYIDRKDMNNVYRFTDANWYVHLSS